MRGTAHLTVVREEPAPGIEGRQAGPAQGVPDPHDLLLLAFLFLLDAIPVAGELAGIGRWSPGVVGLAAGAMVLSGRELWSQVRAVRLPWSS